MHKSKLWFYNSMIRCILSLLLTMQGIPTLSIASDSLLTLKIVAPEGLPNPITDISACPDFSYPEKAEKIKLSWTAPKAGNDESVFSYAIRYATFSVSDLNNNILSWWDHPNTLTAFMDGFPKDWGYPASASWGEKEIITLTNLSPSKIYYFGVRAYDRYHRLGAYDTQIQGLSTQSSSYATPQPLTPAKITNLVATQGRDMFSVNLAWTVPEFINNESQLIWGRIDFPGEYCIQYSTNIPPESINNPSDTNNWFDSTRIFISTSNISTGQQQYYTVTGLILDTTYYFHLFTRNEWPNRWSMQTNQYAQAKPYVYLEQVKDISVSVFGSSDTALGSYINLQWLNPSEEHQKGVRISYSTTTYPISPFEQYDFSELISVSSETLSQKSYLQLLPKTTYYFCIFTTDMAQHYSSPSCILAYTSIDKLAPDNINNLSYNINVDHSELKDIYSIKLNWTNPPSLPLYKNSDFEGVNIYYSTSTQDISLQKFLAKITGDNYGYQEFILNDINTYTTYYFSFQSFDKVNNISTYTITTSIYVSEQYISPEPVTNVLISITSLEDASYGCGIKLSWTNSSSPFSSGVKILARTDTYPQSHQDGIVWFNQNTTPNKNMEYERFNLSPNTTYFITIYSFSIHGNYSRPYRISGFTKILWYDSVAPLSPMGLTLNREERLETLSWNPVKYNINGNKFMSHNSPLLSELYGYEVYTSTSIFSPNWKLEGKIIGNNTNRFIYNNNENKIIYYKVRSIDISGNGSDSYIINSENNIFIINDDGSYIMLPYELSTAINKYYNINEKDIIIKFQEYLEEENETIIKSISWDAYEITETTDSFKLNKIDRFNINKYADFYNKNAELGISYNLANQLSIKNSYDINKDTIDKSLSIFYFNGLQWLKLPTTNDKLNRLSITSMRFSGKYQLRHSPPATEFTFYGIMPKIITPNNDGQNDVLIFRFANPKSSKVNIKIFNREGILIKKMDLYNSSDVHGDYIDWDGRNDSNSIVQPGIYLYQIESEGKIFNGTIIVAR